MSQLYVLWPPEILPVQTTYYHPAPYENTSWNARPSAKNIIIITTLKTSPGRQEEALKPNFKSTNWPKFCKELTKKLDSIDAQHDILNESEFYRRLNTLTLAITDTIESAVLKTRPSPFTK